MTKLLRPTFCKVIWTVKTKNEALSFLRYLFSALFLLGFISLIIVGLYLTTPYDYSREAKIVEVLPGESLAKISRHLKMTKVIKERILFNIIARLMGKDISIKAGEYEFMTSMTPMEVLRKLIRGEVIRIKVTIPEGFNISQIALLLENLGLGKAEKILSLSKDLFFISSLGIKVNNLEGYLFPNTYFFSRELKEEGMIRMMTENFLTTYNKHFSKMADEKGFSMQAVIILASIIEKESKISSEKPIIAGVFFNRLRKGIKLQSDPTVIYGLKDFGGGLRKKDLRSKTPFNTYRIRGLPPSPISNPGFFSIQAVLFPSRVDYLYFVSKNDGTHYFSKTLVEHNRAVAKYQKKITVGSKIRGFKGSNEITENFEEPKAITKSLENKQLNPSNLESLNPF